ncbi:MAG: hypothetical protein ABI237_07605 [Ginsengibacter sp.]
MKEKKQKEPVKKKVTKKGKGKYYEEVKIEASLQELINMAASGKKKK